MAQPTPEASFPEQSALDDINQSGGEEQPTRMTPFMEKVLASNVSPDAQIFTEAAPPFKIVHVNPAWTLLCGFESHEALGRTCKILQGPETSADALRELHAALQERRAATVRLRNYTKKREVFLNELTVAPLVGEEGDEVTHFVVTLRRRDAPGPPRPDRATPADAFAAAQPPPTSAGGKAARAAGQLAPAPRCTKSGQASLPLGAEAESARRGNECADMLLSRDAFPLHTLNHHPVAPVLLRMLQLNTAGCQPGAQPSGEGGAAGSGTLDEAGARSRGGGLGAALERLEADSAASPALFALLRSSIAGADGRPRWAAPDGVAGSAAAAAAAVADVAAAAAPAAAASGAGGTCAGVEPAGAGAASASGGAASTLLGDRQTFLSAVARQGVLSPGSWPRPPTPPHGSQRHASREEASSCPCRAASCAGAAAAESTAAAPAAAAATAGRRTAKPRASGTRKRTCGSKAENSRNSRAAASSQPAASGGAAEEGELPTESFGLLGRHALFSELQLPHMPLQQRAELPAERAQLPHSASADDMLAVLGADAMLDALGDWEDFERLPALDVAPGGGMLDGGALEGDAEASDEFEAFHELGGS